MRLLVINFEMDPASQVLAWQLHVASELASKCEKVVILTHRVAEFVCPSNMTVCVFPTLLQRAPLRWLGGNWWMNIFVWQTPPPDDRCHGSVVGARADCAVPPSHHRRPINARGP